MEPLSAFAAYQASLAHNNKAKSSNKQKTSKKNKSKFVESQQPAQKVSHNGFIDQSKTNI